MTQSNKDEIYKKWAPILNNIGLTGSKANWMAEYAEIHSKQDSINITEENTTILPMSIKVVSQTIGLDLVTVQPLSNPISSGNSSEELKRIEAEIKAENRENKIESILDGKEYQEKSIKDHKDYKNGLLYIDFKYDSNSGKKTRRSGKKHKKKDNDNI
jgi:hypothetical protein